MDMLTQLVEAISEKAGIAPGRVLLGAAVLLLILLFSFRKNFWGTFKFVLIVAALGTLGYFAYNVAAVGLAKRESLLNKPTDLKQLSP